MKPIKERILTVDLSLAAIDEVSDFVMEAFGGLELSRKELIRCRLSAEEVLTIWRDTLGEDAVCTVICGNRLRTPFIRLSVPGDRVNPKEYNDGLYLEMLSNSGLLFNLDVGMQYRHVNRVNEVTLTPPKKAGTPIASVALAIVLSVGLGLLLKRFFPDVGAALASAFVSPVFDTIMNMIFTLAGPMIFLSVCTSICGIGNLATVERMSKTLLVNFVRMTFLPMILFGLAVMWLFPLSLHGGGVGGGEGAGQIWQMILNTVPTDIITPFQTGNALQIIFLGCASGIGILVLGNRVSSLNQVVGQLNSTVCLLMEAIGKIIPLFIFVSLLDLILTSEDLEFAILARVLLLVGAFLVAMAAYYTLRIAQRWKMPPGKVLKKFLPTFIIAITTASSSAAFATNIQTCHRDLGVDEKLVNYGIPLGQVVYMVAGGVEFMIFAMCCAEFCGTAITPIWLVNLVLVAGILTIATPPIPGGSLSCLTILFAHLGIPAEGIAIAVGFGLLTDFITTANNLLCLQGEMVFVAKKLDMLDEDALRT